MRTIDIGNRTNGGALADIVALEDTPRAVVAAPIDYPEGYRIPMHRHRRGQLIFASAGVMRVESAEGLWVAPPNRAIWMPAGQPHALALSGRVAMRTLYLAPELHPGPFPDLPARCSVLAVPPLLRELVLEAMTLPRLYDVDGADGRLVGVLLDRLRTLRTAPLHLPMPRDPRLRGLVAALAATPDDPRTLEDWALASGASARTLARLFRRETGLTFGQWRQQVRLLEALTRLAGGESVTTVALDLGYDSPSAFIAMFRRALGVTPGRYFAAD